MIEVLLRHVSSINNTKNTRCVFTNSVYIYICRYESTFIERGYVDVGTRIPSANQNHLREKIL